MSYGGIHNWPPIWTSTVTGVRSFGRELGVLKSARLLEHSPAKCYLIVEHEKLTYMGCLMFDDMTFCKQIYELLQFHIGRSIADIGNIELSHTL